MDTWPRMGTLERDLTRVAACGIAAVFTVATIVGIIIGLAVKADR